MPIPLIIVAVVLVTTATAGTGHTAYAVCRITDAKQRYRKRYEAYQAFCESMECSRQQLDAQSARLLKARLKAQVCLGECIRMIGNSRLKNRQFDAALNLPRSKWRDWERASVNAGHILGGLATSLGSGVATTAGTYNLVALLGYASTGTAIKTLSGAAVSKATLAALGGGTLASGGGGMAAGTLVLGGIFIGPTLVAIGFMANWQAAKVECEVEAHIAKLDRDQAIKRKSLSAMRVVEQRIEELRGATVKMTRALRRLMTKTNDCHLQDLLRLTRLAAGLGRLIEIPVLDPYGHVSDVSISNPQGSLS